MSTVTESVTVSEEAREKSPAITELHPAFQERIWKPGQSGNPSGRPKKPLTERLIAKLMQEDGEAAKRVVDALYAHSQSDNPKSASASVKAIEEIFDRVEGKVEQPIRQSGTITHEFVDFAGLSDEQVEAALAGIEAATTPGDSGGSAR